MYPANEPTSFIVAETGAQWTSWAKRFSLGTPSFVTLTQAHGESPGEFAMRVRTVVLSFVAGGGRVARAVLVGGGGRGPEVLAARALTLRALVTPMAEAREGTMLLDGEGPDRFSMMGLASTVASQIEGTGVIVAAAPGLVAARVVA